jgi:hypothetical protein
MNLIKDLGTGAISRDLSRDCLAKPINRDHLVSSLAASRLVYSRSGEDRRVVLCSPADRPENIRERSSG